MINKNNKMLHKIHFYSSRPHKIEKVAESIERTSHHNLSLSLFIFSSPLPLLPQNGSILEGLLLWKTNLDKHFAGLDDCMICFSIIHGSNYSLPKMICRTCKKRFHSSCLVSHYYNILLLSTCTYL